MRASSSRLDDWEKWACRLLIRFTARTAFWDDADIHCSCETSPKVPLPKCFTDRQRSTPDEESWCQSPSSFRASSRQGRRSSLRMDSMGKLDVRLAGSHGLEGLKVEDRS